ncbi:MAG: efflux RND transporter permease subunit, partial [Bacteroidota bacterium]
LEINLAEYFVRGLGYVETLTDIEESVVTEQNNVPIRIGDIAHVHLGPANRRGVLDKSGTEAVGGVVVARFGAKPLEVIEQVKQKISSLEPGLPQKTLSDGRISQINIIPFYDRTQLIQETLGTLQEALSLEILVTLIVIILMLFDLKTSLLVSSSLPIAVLMCFIAMRYFGVNANIVALSGIAIAIGTIVDMGIVLGENMVKKLEEGIPGSNLLDTLYAATVEVGSAILTAVATTVISFLPVFTMEAAEGKLFRPLAYTKSFALIASIIIVLTFLPTLAHSLFSLKMGKNIWSYIGNGLLLIAGAILLNFLPLPYGISLLLLGSIGILETWMEKRLPSRKARMRQIKITLYGGLITFFLARMWVPLGVSKTLFLNFLFVGGMIALLLGFFSLLIQYYSSILRVLLQYKFLFFGLIGLLILLAVRVWRNTGEEFMPPLAEGSYLLMPTAMPHTGMQASLQNLQVLDMAVTAIPEVESVVGKAGRVESSLDPAPISMYENIILYKSEFKTDEKGRRIRFSYDPQTSSYRRTSTGELIPDPSGRYYRQWREHIQDPEDIWEEIVRATRLPGVTSAPKLQPIQTRLVMLQSGMRSPMGIKVQGTDLASIEDFGRILAQYLGAVEGVQDATVFAERIVGKPYVLIKINRKSISRYGLRVEDVQRYIQAAVGGMKLSTTVEGRERYSIRVRYPRELRDDPELLKRMYVSTPKGIHIPLGDLVDITYEQGPQSIKSEDGFLVGYVLFDKERTYSEVEVVENARRYLEQKIAEGDLSIPSGLSYRFAGTYEQQVRANKRLAIVIPMALVLIFLILYLQFRSVAISFMVFSGIIVAFTGGFLMIGLYDQAWFLNFELLGSSMREVFQIHPINLSVAVWVGFLALFGIATDDGVLVATFLRDSFRSKKPQTVTEIREAVIIGGMRRVRPAMMTTATTLIALLPILTSTGRGAEIMIPMAIPTFGGMVFQSITLFTVPILYSMWQEWRIKRIGHAKEIP